MPLLVVHTDQEWSTHPDWRERRVSIANFHRQRPRNRAGAQNKGRERVNYRQNAL